MDLSTTAPVAMKQAHSMTIHQHTRQDDYFWLRDDERKNKQVLSYLEQENKKNLGLSTHRELLISGKLLCDIFTF